jgi:hypothetical protein
VARAQDTDPGNHKSAIEVESSPVVDTAVNPPEVLVGNDDNGTPGIAVTGLMGFNAKTGHVLRHEQRAAVPTQATGVWGFTDLLSLNPLSG